ncbi:MAG: putative transcriptional regulator, TetR family [Acidimicrobiia bacterium]|nr:putative transcriptional regulator, TetR family [Acidimicrobiia bacterium]
MVGEVDGTSQRQWQRDRTAAAIEGAALRVLLKRGFEAVTAQEIASAAHVSERTFFRYFPGGKVDVMVLTARRPMLRLRQLLEARPPQEGGLEALRQALTELTDPGSDISTDDAAHLYAQIAVGHPGLLARMMGERQIAAEGLVGELALRMGVDPSADIRPRLLAYCLHAVMSAWWLTWLDGAGHEAWDLLESAFRAMDQQAQSVEVRH